MSIIEKAVNKADHAEHQLSNGIGLSTEAGLYIEEDSSLTASATSSTIEKNANKTDEANQTLNDKTGLSSETGSFAAGKSTLSQSEPTKNDVGLKKMGTYSGNRNRVDIDWAKLAELGFVTPSDVNTKTIEEYRNIKRPLVYNAFGAGSEGIARSNLILVTSSVPGEGKTFTAINLALSIANERDKNVLLIDADVARPSVSKTLGIHSPSRLGLIDYLEGGNVSYSDIELETNMEGLSIIPAGKLHKYSTELLASNKMALLAEELSKKYPDRIVIFDSPPLLAATQGEVLAKLVGQVVLVVEAEKTFQSMVMESVSKLSDCDVVLLVFNKTLIGLSDGYYYGYGYGQYATH